MASLLARIISVRGLQQSVTRGLTTNNQIPRRYESTSLNLTNTLADEAPSPPRTTNILGTDYTLDSMTNITPTITGLVGRKLHLAPHHPVNIIKQRVVHHFHKTYVSRTGNAIYAHFDNVQPVVSTEQNFDSLLIPKGHVARSRNDNYYVNEDTVLRGHTSAHQRDFIKMGFDQFLVTGDVYRRDEIDRNHYPSFHQMEGVRLYSKDELFKSCSDDNSLELFEKGSDLDAETGDKQAMHTIDAVKMMEIDLKGTLVKLVKELFGNETEFRWNSCYFPFTHPSFELEIKFKGEWLEVLGSGIMRQQILVKGGAHNKIGWAFGLGLDRLAMLLFDIPDIRLFWSRDERFLNQFLSVGIDPKTNIKFSPYSKYPPCYKDIAFWLPPCESKDKHVGFSENDFFDVVRSASDDLVETVEKVDEFVHPTSGKDSRCYRITYRSMDKTMTNEEVNAIHNSVRKMCTKLGVELR